MDKNNMKNEEECLIRGIHNYQEADIKEIVRKSKNLDPKAMEYIATVIFRAIKADLYGKTGDRPAEVLSKTLLMHAPSSSFARGQKRRDHMAIILEKIKDTADLEIDICLHAFIIDVDKRKSQHEKDKAERISDSKTRYKLLFKTPLMWDTKFDQNFIHSYDLIYVLDDVQTTGATLQILTSIISEIVLNNRSGVNLPQVRGLAFCH